MSLDRNEKVKNNAEIPQEIPLSQRDSQIKSLDDSSFDYDNEIKELSDETIDLMTAIKNNNLLQAATAIKAGARVNALVTSQEHNFSTSISARNGTKDSYFATPLQFAIFQMNYEMVRLLLQEGADPNKLTSRNESTLELLLIHIGNRAMQQTMGVEEQRTPAFLKKLNIHTKFSVKVKLKDEQIRLADDLLDLLLCYNLNPKPIWTDHFINGKKHLDEAMQYAEKADRKKTTAKLMPQLAETAVSAYYADDNKIKGKIFSKLAKAGAWIYLKRTNVNSKDNCKVIREYLKTENSMLAETKERAEKIKQEKAHLLALYHQYASDLHTRYRFNHGLINLVLGYAVDVSNEVAEKRHHEKHASTFWQREQKQVAKIDETQKEILKQKVKIGVRVGKCLHPFFANTPQAFDIVETIAAYAVEAKADLPEGNAKKIK